MTSKQPVKLASTSDVADKHPLGSFEQSITEKNMHSGSREPNIYTQFIIDDEGKMTAEDLEYSSALMKAVDEALVNALDHAIRMKGASDKELQVSMIRVTFNVETGEISIYNSGQGVPIEFHSEAGKYLPEVFFSEGYNGTNVKKSATMTIGGTNGIGIKLTNSHSLYFKLKTVHKRFVAHYYSPKGVSISYEKYKRALARGLNVKTAELFDAYYEYSQAWQGLSNASEPKLYKIAPKRPYTKITFMPDYTGLFKTDFEDNKGTIERLIKTRVYMASIFIGWIGGRCKMYYNDQKVPVNTFKGLCGAFPPDMSVFEINLKSTQNSDYLWNIVLIIGPHNKTINGFAPQLTNINGIVCQSGKHTDKIIEIIHGKVKHLLKQEFGDAITRLQKAYIYNNLFIFGNYLVPGEIWDSQRKDNATGIPLAYLRGFKLEEALEAPAKKVAALVKAEMNPAKKAKPNKYVKIVNGPDIYDAKMAGATKKKRAKACYLLVPEGLSSLKFCVNGYSYRDTKTGKYNYDPSYVGAITLGGVIANIKKWYIESISGRRVKIDFEGENNSYEGLDASLDGEGANFDQEYANDINFGPDELNAYFDAEKVITLKQKLLDNKFFTNFLNMTGLNINYSYSKSDPDYDRQISELRYDAIVCCVDQDHDGKGLIFSLILNIFVTFWPNLFNYGFIRRFETPIIRLYPKKKTGAFIEFQHMFQYQKWAADNPDENKNYEVKYLKGLAGNTKLEAQRLFKDFDKKLFVYKYDKRAQKVFNDFFGPNSEPRKEFLRRPQEQIPYRLLDRQLSTHKVCVSDHVWYELGAHQKYRLERSIPSAIDGLVSVNRKILFTGLKIWARNNKEVKVANLQAIVQTTTEYAHGDAPLVKAIFKCMFICSGGGKQLPFLVPCGTGSSRSDGGAKNPAARYVYTKLNKGLTNLLYPTDDAQLLDYKVEENHKIEPRYYVPILPMAILESISAPACGWQIKCWGRCALEVIKKLKILIFIDKRDKCIIKTRHIMPLKLCECNYDGYSTYYKGKKTSFGRYYLTDRSIIITELPLRIWYDKYINMLNKKKMKVTIDDKVHQVFDDIHSSSNDDTIRIEVVFSAPKNGFDPIEYINNNFGDQLIDCYVDYFHLYTLMDDQLNFLDTNGDVREFGSYEEVMANWYHIRRDMYARRIDRQLIIKRLEILRQKNVVKFIEVFSAMTTGIKKCQDATEAHEFMQAQGFIGFNSANYLKLAEFATEDIEAKVLHEGPSYGYLLDKITASQAIKAKLASLRARVEALEADFEAYKRLVNSGPFKGAQIWLNELEKAYTVISAGKASGWTAEE